MRIKKGDVVTVLSGKDKGRTGEVIAVYPTVGRVVVKGINIVTKHNRPTNANPNGGIEKKEASMNVSKVAYLDPKEKKATKIGYKFVEKDGKSVKVRYCKLSGTVLDK
jgi:large subunit ribosomal protein L24